MLVDHQHYRTIWLKADDMRVVQVIDQTRLPHAFEILDVCTVSEACLAIRNMTVRGAGLIGACAAFGMYLAALEAADSNFASVVCWSLRCFSWASRVGRCALSKSSASQMAAKNSSHLMAGA